MIKLQQRKRQLDIFWLLMGGVASIVGLALLVPFADSLLWHEEKSWAFLVPAVLSLALGLGFGWLGRDHKRQINVWEGALFMVLVWPLLSVLGMMPYVLSGVLTSPVDAFFESVAAITTTGTLAQDGKSLVMKVDGVKYAFTLAPAAKDGDTLLTLSYTGDTEIGKGDVTVGTSGLLRNLKKGEKVYLLKKTNGKLIATDITDTVNLPTIYGTITGTVAEDASNNLVLTVTNAESLTDAGDSYKYIKVVEVPAENAGNTITVEACGNADRSAIAALAKDETDATELKDNTLTVQGKVKGRAVGANSVAGNATENNVTIGVGATVDGFVAGGLTADGTANGNTVTINGGTITGDVYGGYSEKEANDNIVNLAGGTIKGTVYGGYVPDAPAATSVRSKRSMPRRTLAATASSTSGNTLNVTKATTVGNLAKFDTYNFYLPAETKANDVLLHLVSNENTDMRGGMVNVHADGSTKLNAAEKVYLIQKEGGSLLTDAAIKQNVDVLVGVTAKLNGTVTKENNNLVLTTKAVSASSSGGSGGSAHMRYKTGSHVDARGTAFNAGIAKKNANKSGTFTWGPFFETGQGNYDSYLDNGTHGSGSTSYTGGGIFARQDFASGCYVEGALRLGKTKAENQLSKWYAGAALLYEFGGEARAHFQGYSLASPSSSGASVMLEGGWKYTPSATSPVELDLGATGWLGKQQGADVPCGHQLCVQK